MEERNSLIKSHVAAFVFAGGSSSRFGSNKAFFELDGKPMIEWVAGSIGAAARCVPTYVGLHDQVESSHSAVLIGKREGTGPLGALCDALDSVSAQFVLIAPCDTPYFSAKSFTRLLTQMHQSAAVVAVDNQQPDNTHWLLSCWNADVCRTHLSNQFDSGERAVHRAIAGLDIRFESFDERELRNINSPTDLE